MPSGRPNARGDRSSEDRRRPSYERGPGPIKLRSSAFPRGNANRRTGTDGSGRGPSSPPRDGQRQAGRGTSSAPEGRWPRGGSGDYGAARDRGFGRSGAGNSRREGAQERRPGLPRLVAAKRCRRTGAACPAMAPALLVTTAPRLRDWSRARESAQPGRGRNGEGKTANGQATSPEDTIGSRHHTPNQMDGRSPSSRLTCAVSSG